MTAACFDDVAKAVARFIAHAICFLVVIVSFPVVVMAGIGVIVLVIVRFCDPPLSSDEGGIVPRVMALSFVVASIALTGSVWLRRKLIGKEVNDDSFRLVKSAPSKSYGQGRVSSGVVVLVAASVWLWLLAPEKSLALKAPTVFAWLIVVIVGLYLYIAFHESAHLLAGFCVNMGLQKIQIGAGHLIFSHRFANGFRFELRASPFGGCVFASPRRLGGSRFRGVLFVGAGPLADLILLSVAYQVIVQCFGGLWAALIHGPGGFVMVFLFWITALSAVNGIFPHKVWNGVREVETDGYLLFRLLTGRHFAFAYDAESVMEKFGREFAQMGIPRQQPETVAGLPGFAEQRARLSTQLLRRPGSTSLPQA